jgi:hypothetical protein
MSPALAPVFTTNAAWPVEFIGNPLPMREKEATYCMTKLVLCRGLSLFKHESPSQSVLGVTGLNR